MKFIGIIPARYASTRFPAKPLAMLGGKTGTTISTGYARSGKLEEKGRSRKKPQTSRTGRAKNAGS